jgi:hypothetical protein
MISVPPTGNLCAPSLLLYHHNKLEERIGVLEDRLNETEKQHKTDGVV